MKRRPLVLFAIIAGNLALSAATIVTPLQSACAQSSQSGYADRSPKSFAEDVMPIFRGRCISCHQPGGQGYEKSGVDLTGYDGLMKGTKYGQIVVPGQPFVSNLMVLLDWRASPQLRMPHGAKQLSICDRTAISAWIQQGAKNN
jgi:mono/diheme cytochrome c family protein